MGLIALTALLANLPQEYVEQTLGVSPAFLVAVLGSRSSWACSCI